MGRPFPLRLRDDEPATAVRVDGAEDLPAALAALGLHAPRPVIVLVGGASGLDPDDEQRIRRVLDRGVAPVMSRLGAAVVDGGTRSGVMRLMGEAHAAAGADAPLLGVAAVGTVTLPDVDTPSQDTASLDPDHTHFVLVPGQEWGAESQWIASVATELAGTAPSVTMLVNGGEIAYADVERSIAAARPVVVLAGSGRTADKVAAALRGEPADERAVAVARSELVSAADVREPEALARQLVAILAEPVAERGAARVT